jgi:hypothetical protein
MLANLKLWSAISGDTVTVRVRLRSYASTGALVALATPTVVTQTVTPLRLLPGNGQYPWNIQRVFSATTGATVGWRVQDDQVPVPYGPPPNGYSCGAALQIFVGNQVGCYGEWAGTELLLPFYEAAKAAKDASIGCAASLLVPGTGAVGYLRCVSGFAGVGFAQGIVDNVFGIEGGSMGGASYHSESCSSIERARISIQQYCQL